MKIYLCGSCGSTERTQMVKVAELLRSLGYDVYCPFELKIPNAWDMPQEDWAEKVFKADVQAIESEELSEREKDVLIQVVKGLSNKEIADVLCISTHTVISHRKNITRKLNIHSTAGLTIYAIVNKLVDLDSL